MNIGRGLQLFNASGDGGVSYLWVLDPDEPLDEVLARLCAVFGPVSAEAVFSDEDVELCTEIGASLQIRRQPPVHRRTLL